MMDVFESMESDLDATMQQNEIFKDQLFEATFKHDVEKCVLMCFGSMDDDLTAEIEKVKRESNDVQENLHKRIKILEYDVQRCQKQSLDFELQLQHEKEKTKCESSLKNLCETSWISKMKKLENENVSLEFQEINELIESVNQKTYAYGDVRAHNQDLLITIFELKSKLKYVEKGLKDVTSVRRSSSRSSLFKNNVLSNTKNHSEDVEVHVRTNKKTNITSKKNVVQIKKIVTNVDVKNALKANDDIFCVSCEKNVLTPCHDKCLAKYKLSANSKVRRALYTTPRTVKSSLDTTTIVTKTRFAIDSPYILIKNMNFHEASNADDVFCGL
ncbi:hypothetical protein Tco_0655110 [Tanacetum coccineum]|uniref:Uncharacterized protein n=1 Tax=Tanacetum coccineum TaxID=301880 RepID=A0ABQ4X546_9ASTR